MNAAESGFPYRMRDLVQLTGLPPASLHFYAASGLLPEPLRIGRTRARYRAETVERVRWIRTLQQELGLPLKALKSLLDREGQVPVEQVRTRLALGESLAQSLERGQSGEAPSAVSEEDVAVLRAHGLEPDDRLLDLVAAMQRAGFDAENGFAVTQIAAYRDAVRRLVQTELRLMLGPTLARLGAERTAELLVRGLPLVDELLTLFHHRAFAEEFAFWKQLVAERAAGSRESGDGAR